MTIEDYEKLKQYIATVIDGPGYDREALVFVMECVAKLFRDRMD